MPHVALLWLRLRGLLTVAASFSPRVGSGRTGVSGGTRVNCPAACAVFPEQRLEPCRLHRRQIRNHRTTREATCRYLFAELEKNPCGSLVAQRDCPSGSGSRGCSRTEMPSATLSWTARPAVLRASSKEPVVGGGEARGCPLIGRLPAQQGRRRPSPPLPGQGAPHVPLLFQHTSEQRLLAPPTPAPSLLTNRQSQAVPRARPGQTGRTPSPWPHPAQLAGDQAFSAGLSRIRGDGQFRRWELCANVALLEPQTSLLPTTDA